MAKLSKAQTILLILEKLSAELEKAKVNRAKADIENERIKEVRKEFPDKDWALIAQVINHGSKNPIPGLEKSIKIIQDMAKELSIAI